MVVDVVMDSGLVFAGGLAFQDTKYRTRTRLSALACVSNVLVVEPHKILSFQ